MAGISRSTPPKGAPQEAPAASLHASALVLGERGVLILGASGSGKSTLTALLCASWEQAGWGQAGWGQAGQGAPPLFATLVADDRVLLRAQNGRLIAAPHPVIAGKLELRALGLLARPYLATARLDLVVSLEDTAARLPQPAQWSHAGVALPWVKLARSDPPAVLAHKLRAALQALEQASR